MKQKYETYFSYNSDYHFPFQNYSEIITPPMPHDLIFFSLGVGNIQTPKD